MAFPNLTDIVTTTLDNRSTEIADNVTDNNAILLWIKKKGGVKVTDGGERILEHISYAENGNGGSYSGYDQLPMAPQDVISSAVFEWKQYAVPVTISGLEQLKNSGRAALIDLMDARMEVAEATMANLLAEDAYSDGTGNNGKDIVGLDAMVPADPTTGTYGGINRATWTFWRSQVHDPASTPTSSTIQAEMTTLWVSCTRGTEKPNLILSGNTLWKTYQASLQPLQRFTSPEVANLGFEAVKFMSADVVLDGGIGGNANATTMYFLNTKYLRWRPHKDRNMRALAPGTRRSVNQDAEVSILAWAGNMTCSSPRLQGRLIGS